MVKRCSRKTPSTLQLTLQCLCICVLACSITVHKVLHVPLDNTIRWSINTKAVQRKPRAGCIFRGTSGTLMHAVCYAPSVSRKCFFLWNGKCFKAVREGKSLAPSSCFSAPDSAGHENGEAPEWQKFSSACCRGYHTFGTMTLHGFPGPKPGITEFCFQNFFHTSCKGRSVIKWRWSLLQNAENSNTFFKKPVFPVTTPLLYLLLKK